MKKTFLLLALFVSFDVSAEVLNFKCKDNNIIFENIKKSESQLNQFKITYYLNDDLDVSLVNTDASWRLKWRANDDYSGPQYDKNKVVIKNFLKNHSREELLATYFDTFTLDAFVLYYSKSIFTKNSSNSFTAILQIGDTQSNAFALETVNCQKF